MNPVIYGAAALASLLASLFFLRFWRDSRDRLFLFFCLAFSALAVNWLVLACAPRMSESNGGAYLPRLVAFLLMIAGIADKNRRTSAPQK